MGGRYGFNSTVDLLLECGADLCLVDHDGQSALMHAANNGHTHTVLFLLEQGARVNLTNSDGQTALMYLDLSHAPMYWMG